MERSDSVEAMGGDILVENLREKFKRESERERVRFVICSSGLHATTVANEHFPCEGNEDSFAIFYTQIYHKKYFLSIDLTYRCLAVMPILRLHKQARRCKI